MRSLQRKRAVSRGLTMPVPAIQKRQETRCENQRHLAPCRRSFLAGRHFCYIRVFKSDGPQTLEPQRDALLAAGIDRPECMRIWHRVGTLHGRDRAAAPSCGWQRRAATAWQRSAPARRGCAPTPSPQPRPSQLARAGSGHGRGRTASLRRSAAGWSIVWPQPGGIHRNQTPDALVNG